MRVRAVVMFGLALILASASVVLARAWLESRAQPVAAAPVDARPDTIPLVVAATALRYGERLGAEHLRLVDWPRASVPTGAFHTLDQVLGAQGQQDRTILRAIEKDEPVLSAKVTGFGAPATLATMIAPGMRAASVAVRGDTGMAGLVRPGDRVDVLIARDASDERRGKELVSDILLQDVKVLGLNQDGGVARGAAGTARSVTVEVTVEQAQRLTLAQKLGSLSIALRSHAARDSGRARQVSSRDLQAVAQPSSVETESALSRMFAGKAAGRRSAVRVFRGLEASEYEVTPEAQDQALESRLPDGVRAGSAGRAFPAVDAANTGSWIPRPRRDDVTAP